MQFPSLRVGVDRLAESRVAEPGLNDLRVDIGGDQRRGVEMPEIVKPCPWCDHVARVGARVGASPVVLLWVGRRLATGPGQANCAPPHLAERVAVHEAAVGGRHHKLVRPGPEALKVFSDFVENPAADWHRPHGCLRLERSEGVVLCLLENLDPMKVAIHAGDGQTGGLAEPEASSGTQSYGDPVRILMAPRRGST